MKANKKGISLIVLIITIVVIIILAAAIILSLGKTNVITNANTAVNDSDMKTAQEAFTLWMGDRWVLETTEIGVKYSGTIDSTNEKLKYVATHEDTDSDGVIDEGEKVTYIDVDCSLEDLGLESLKSVTIENNVVKDITK